MKLLSLVEDLHQHQQHKARVTHNFTPLNSSSTLNFPYNAKIPTGTALTLVETSGTLPAPLQPNTTYYAVARTTANGLADNQIKLAASLADANTETTIAFTSVALGDPVTGQAYFSVQTTDLGDNIIAYMKQHSSLLEREYIKVLLLLHIQHMDLLRTGILVVEL